LTCRTLAVLAARYSTPRWPNSAASAWAAGRTRAAGRSSAARPILDQVDRPGQRL